MRYLLRGLGWTARNPSFWLLGLVPALITLVLYVAGLAALGVYADDIAAWTTPFADGWPEGLRNATRLVAGLAIFGAGVFLGLVTFTAVTLLIGDPFYEKIAVAVEESQGGAPPEVDASLLSQMMRAVRDTLILGVLALGFALVFFVCGFIPGVGQTVVPVVAASVSGYFLAGELTSIALDRRGIYRRDRLALLRRDRPLAVGFGAATVALFLIPLGAVLAMPGAVAGGTLLARERLAPPPDSTRAVKAGGPGQARQPPQPAPQRPPHGGDPHTGSPF